MRCKLPLFVTLFTLALISQSLFASTDTTVGSCTGPGTYYATISAVSYTHLDVYKRQP